MGTILSGGEDSKLIKWKPASSAPSSNSTHQNELKVKPNRRRKTFFFLLLRFNHSHIQKDQIKARKTDI